MKKGKFYVISGPSGTGKGSIRGEVLKENLSLEFSVSFTTRSPRDGEVHGKDYFFVSKEEFEKKIANNDFLEHTETFGNYYGTEKAFVNTLLSAGKDVILEIDVKGAMKIKETYFGAVFIFILPPSYQELVERIRGRGTEDEASLKKRVTEAAKEIEYLADYDYCVINDDLELAVEKVQAIIVAERAKLCDEYFKYIDLFKEEEENAIPIN
ncbi:MAG: guanylate kinase [Anaerovoracaceae bacterium]